jgi:hypothetical protein
MAAEFSASQEGLSSARKKVSKVTILPLISILSPIHPEAKRSETGGGRYCKFEVSKDHIK